MELDSLDFLSVAHLHVKQMFEIDGPYRKQPIAPKLFD
jgi:hypothetical protein